MNSTIVQLGDTKILWLLLTENGNGIPDQWPTIEIRRHSDWYYVDFDTDTFTDVGGRREEFLAEHMDMRGYYSFEFDPTVYGDLARETYSIIYRNDSTEYGAFIIEEIAFEDANNRDIEVQNSVEFLRKVLTNKTILRKLGIGHFEQEFFDDDNASIIKKDDIVKIGDEEIREPQ